MKIRVFHKSYTEEALEGLREEDITAVDDADERAALLFLHQMYIGQVAYDMFTSGSTGTPKKIVVRWLQMIRSAASTTAFLRLKSIRRCLIALSLQHIAGKMMWVRAVLKGMDVDIVKPSSALLENLGADHPYELTSLVPLQLESIFTKPEAVNALERFRIVLIGGAALSGRLQKELEKMQHVALWQTYGMTETVSHIALRRINGPEASPFYQPLPGVELKTDERGCLCIKSPVTQNQWIMTNDLVRIQHSGGFYLVGRADEVINSGGIKIHPTVVEPVVEDVMWEFKLERNFFIGALPDEKLGQKPVLVLEGKPLTTEIQKELMSHLKSVLPAWHAPAHLFFVERFLLTSGGKADKLRMLASFLKE